MKIKEAWIDTIARIKQLIHEEQQKRWLMLKALYETKFNKQQQPKDYHDK